MGLPARAQFDGAGQHQLAPMVQDIEHIASADIDGDGDLDLITSAVVEGWTGWLENAGAGSFEEFHPLTNEAIYPRHMAVGDFNGDGAPDVVLFTPALDHFECFKNTGNGDFAPAMFLADGPTLVSDMMTCDLENDGDLDLVYTSFATDTIYLLENDGAGNFSAYGSVTEVDVQAHRVACVDLDADGDLDLAWASFQDGTIGWYENTGDGVDQTLHVLASVGSPAEEVIASDVDGDGDQDVLYRFDFISEQNTDLAYLENLADGTFSPLTYLPNMQASSPLIVADFDQDGDLDIAAAENGLKVYDHLGNWEFSEALVLAESQTSTSAATAADLDGNGYPDPLLLSASNNGVSWFPSGPSGFADQRFVSELASSAHYQFGDIDGDGLPDQWVGFDSWISRFGWRKNFGNNHFSGLQPLSPAYEHLQPNALLGDVDGDGDLDAVGSAVLEEEGSSAYSQVFWYANNGAGFTTTSQVLIEASAFERLHRLEDIDLDGDLDLVVIGDDPEIPEGLFWLENLGDLQFSEKVLVYDGVVDHRLKHTFWADLDNDNDLDLVYGTTGFDLVWVENQGENGFGTPQSILPTPLGIESVSPADVDGDGLVDILATVRFWGGVFWSRNLGEGQWAAPAYLLEGTSSVQHAIAADVNGDGHADVLVADAWEAHLTLLLNQGEASFADPTALTYQGCGTPEALHALDIDNDADLDLVWIGASDGQCVSWFENPAVGGCTDPLACNYSPEASFDNGTCYFLGEFASVDADGNGAIGGSDVLLVLSNYGCMGPDCTGDVDGDGVVSTADILAVIGYFGATCP